jgi:hypothetical protein
MIDETSIWFIIVWILLTFAMLGYISILRLELSDMRRSAEFYKKMSELSDQHVQFLKEEKEAEKCL